MKEPFLVMVMHLCASFANAGSLTGGVSSRVEAWLDVLGSAESIG